MCLIFIINFYIIDTYGDLNISNDILEDINKKNREKRSLILTIVRQTKKEMDEIRGSNDFISDYIENI